jgi:hypothetical protein
MAASSIPETWERTSWPTRRDWVFQKHKQLNTKSELKIIFPCVHFHNFMFVSFVSVLRYLLFYNVFPFSMHFYCKFLSVSFLAKSKSVGKYARHMFHALIPKYIKSMLIPLDYPIHQHDSKLIEPSYYAIVGRYANEQ